MTSRKLQVIKAVCDYYTLTRAQIQRLIGVANDRVVRGLLQELYAVRLVNRTRMQVVNPTAGSPAPVYFPTRLGAELVAAEYGDARYLSVTTKTPDWTHLYHWVEVADFHIYLDQAVAGLNGSVSLTGWYSEWDEIDPQGRQPHERFRLFTLIRDKPRLVCAPDAGFALQIGAHSKSYYLELDRSTSGIQQIAHSKSPGYAGLMIGNLHRRHFQTSAESFSVLHLSPTPARRDLLRKAFPGREGATLHRFAASPDWTSPTALTDPIFYSCDEEIPRPLVRLPLEGVA
jgi:Replication-relaxation